MVNFYSTMNAKQLTPIKRRTMNHHTKQSSLSTPFCPESVHRNHIRTIGHRGVTMFHRWLYNSTIIYVLKIDREQLDLKGIIFIKLKPPCRFQLSLSYFNVEYQYGLKPHTRCRVFLHTKQHFIVIVYCLRWLAD